MAATERAAIEQDVRRRCEAADWHGATKLAIEGYGPEVLAYLAAMTRNPTAAQDVFALWCERLWRSLEGFRWESSLRAWAYLLARHALSRRQHEPDRRVVALDDQPELLELAERVHTTTMIYLRTATKNKLAELRGQLDPDDRTLLILRIDRRLPWNDIARAMGDEHTSEGDLNAFAAVLRKRFERAKNRLRKLLETTRTE